MKGWLTGAIYGLTAVIGLVAFTYPFFLPQLLQGENPESLALVNAPLLTMVLLVLSLAVLLIEIQGQAVNAKVVAALGLLVAVTSVLRFLETAIPGPGGFSPIFVPIILAGYVFGARFGFLMGTLTLFSSALVTGGIGPWLPYQMFVTGWVGLTAGWLPKPAHPGREMAMLAVFSFVWGLLFGLIVNLYFWPFFTGEPALAWQPGDGWKTTLAHYLAFYLTTSLLWDLLRSIGNISLVLLLGLPIIRALSRFRDRFQFEVA
jgi:energy-coupling factor transport system substrate-specific component